MPAQNVSYCASSSAFFFLPIARRSRSARAEGVAGDLLGDRHDLLLVDDQAVGVAEDLRQRLGQLGVDRHDRLAAVLAVGVLVVRVRAHRARAGTAR